MQEGNVPETLLTSGLREYPIVYLILPLRSILKPALSTRYWSRPAAYLFPSFYQPIPGFAVKLDLWSVRTVAAQCRSSYAGECPDS
jgi:hypothetical protein